ncbi:MAG: hypothetical protein M0C28_24195 [Candidatus Moduliflexus flocculans]|nr:hypothetical protein [Candidatus Moduliflexus flocculans]
MLYCPENGTEADPIRRAALALADGTVLEGVGFGASAEDRGKSFSIPGSSATRRASPTRPTAARSSARPTRSSATTASIPARFESDRPQIAGYVVSELCARPSHATSRKTLDDWLRENGVPGIAGIDTRALTKKLRVRGVMTGLLAAADRPARLRPACAARPGSSPTPTPATSSPRSRRPRSASTTRGPPKTVVLIDCGVKMGIVRALVRRGVSVVRVPADTDAGRILAFAPRGVVISNGPGDPRRAGAADRRGPPAPRRAASPLRHLPGQPGPGPGRRRRRPTSSSSATAARTSPASRRAPSAATSPARTTASPSTRPTPAPRLGRLVPQRQRRHQRGHPPRPPARFRRPVPPRGLPRARPTPSSSSTRSSRRPDEEAAARSFSSAAAPSRSARPASSTTPAARPSRPSRRRASRSS